MARRQAVEAALASWREAERHQAAATDGAAEALARDVDHHRDEFQRLSAEHMVEWIAKLHEAERRRSLAIAVHPAIPRRRPGHPGDRRRDLGGCPQQR